MQIDPKFMNEEFEEKTNNRYQKKGAPAPVIQDDEYYAYEDEEIVFNPANTFNPYAEEEAEEAPQAVRTPKHSMDEEVLPGLFSSDILSWKKQFGDVFHVKVKGSDFIIRSLERYEYKEIVATPNSDPLMREEMICEYCVLYPKQFTFASMTNMKAGTPAILSEVIMDYSDFTRDVQVVKL